MVEEAERRQGDRFKEMMREAKEKVMKNVKRRNRSPPIQEKSGFNLKQLKEF